MSATDLVPTEVLSRALGDAIAGRKVRTAVFTSFTFDPGFFELHILPLLFEQSFSQVDKVKRVQLEDAMRGLAEIAVYYDRGGLAQDAEPGLLDYRRIDLRRPHGVFHPKVILLLVDEADENGDPAVDPYQTLIFGCSSANLTRAGWWENVECAHFEEVKDKDIAGERCSFRPDLIALIHLIRRTASSGEEHAALDRIHDFLRKRTVAERFKRARSSSGWFSRVFCGQGHASLAQWLEGLGLEQGEWNLEIVSPFFDAAGAAPLETLVKVVQPKEVRIYLPQETDGSAQVTADAFAAIGGLATWSTLPAPLTSRGSGELAEKLTPRRVHAKVYRLWHGRGRDLLLVGSANLTSAATSHAGAGNAEACFLMDVTEKGHPRRWWLEPLHAEPSRFLSEAADESDGLESALLEVSVRFDWATREFAYRVEGETAPFDIRDSSGGLLLRVERAKRERWIVCPEEVAEKVAMGLRSSSFLLLRHKRGDWRVLVREENVGHRPSLLMDLSPEDIFEYWSLLTAEQRAAFVEFHVGGALEGLPVGRNGKLPPRDTLFDRFAGIFHAFGCLRSHVEDAIDEGREADAATRLLGQKYDSLPCLLEKSLQQEDGDSVVRYVTFLCAMQLHESLRRRNPEFFRSRKVEVRNLAKLLEHLPELGRQVGLESDDAEQFLEWYESAFLKEAVRGELGS